MNDLFSLHHENYMNDLTVAAVTVRVAIEDVDVVAETEVKDGEMVVLVDGFTEVTVTWSYHQPRAGPVASNS